MRGGGRFFVQRNCLCFLTNLGYVYQVGIFCSKELPNYLCFFDRSGVRMPGGGFFVQGNCLWFLRFFGKNSRQFFQRNFFVFEKFWFWGTYLGGGECLDHKKKRLNLFRFWVKMFLVRVSHFVSSRTYFSSRFVVRFANHIFFASFGLFMIRDSQLLTHH